MTLPNVLPSVATHNAGHNNVGLSVISPNKTGSEPKGKSVAASKDAPNKMTNPYSGCDRFVNRD
jgi:hypothetical protein